MFQHQKAINRYISKFTDGLVKIYEQEMEKLMKRNQALRLSEALTKDISDEVAHLIKLNMLERDR